VTSLSRVGVVSGLVCRGTWNGSVTRNGRVYGAVHYGNSGVDNGSILDRRVHINGSTVRSVRILGEVSVRLSLRGGCGRGRRGRRSRGVRRVLV
jgi:hypothetical protein